MKNTITSAIIINAALFFSISANAVNTTHVNTVTTSVNMVSGDWKKSETGTWPGMKDNMTYWYKLDKKAKLWWSQDGKKWMEVKDGAWADKDGKWIKIHNNKLVWSTDGKTWSEVPDWKWEGSDGKWYKFDNKWMLWVNE